MSFYKKYELDRLIADGEARTFRAVETATGRAVFLHLFNPQGQTLLAALRSHIVVTGGKPSRPLIEIGEFAGSPYAVTEALEPFTNLRDWISANILNGNELLEDSNPAIASVMDEPAPPPPSPSLLPDAPGEFTRMFEPAPPPGAQSPPPLPRPGEFTSFFESQTPNPRAQPAPASPPPGEFTRLFEPAGPPAASARPNAGLVAEEPGEFTRLFPESKGPATLPPPRPAGLAGENPGEFTRLFEPAKSTPPPPLPAGTASAGLTGENPGEFTRLFEPAKSTPPLPAATASAGLTGENPGEFARLFEPAKSTPPPPLPAATAPPPPPGPARPPAWPPAPAEPSADTGEFTRLFGGRPSGEAIDIEKEHASAARSAVPENKPFQAAGEFTRMFGPQGVQPAAPSGRQSPPPSLNTATRLSSASGLFGDAEELGRIAAEALGERKPAEAPRDDYAKLFETPDKPAEPEPGAPPKPVVLPPRKSNRDLVIIIAAVVVLVALILAWIFLRK